MTVTAAMPINFPPVDVAAELARGEPGRCAWLASDDCALEGLPVSWLARGVGVTHDERGVVLLVSVHGVDYANLLDPNEAEHLGLELQRRAAFAYQAQAIATAKAQEIPA